MIRIALLGATGRMGTRILELAGNDADVQVVAALVHTDDPAIGNAVSSGGAPITLTAEPACNFDVLVDFSLPAGMRSGLRIASDANRPFVSGTTGISQDDHAALRDAAKRIGVLWASNFSVGITVLLDIAAQTAKRLGNAYNVEIIEAHHNRKVDAPSGTALSLAKSIADATGRNIDRDLVNGRQGAIGPRPAGQIGMHALRLGDEVGRHEIHFGGPGETLVLGHTAWSRDTFARGALVAAKWIVGKPAGIYEMRDVIGSNDGQ